jgi:transposase-like protein
MNPIWTQIIYNAVRDVLKKCPHCNKATAYVQRRPGHSYRCKHCGYMFKEKGGVKDG